MRRSIHVDTRSMLRALSPGSMQLRMMRTSMLTMNPCRWLPGHRIPARRIQVLSCMMHERLSRLGHSNSVTQLGFHHLIQMCLHKSCTHLIISRLGVSQRSHHLVITIPRHLIHSTLTTYRLPLYRQPLLAHGESPLRRAEARLCSRTLVIS